MKTKSWILFWLFIYLSLTTHSQTTDSTKTKSINGFSFGFTFGKFSNKLVGSAYSKQPTGGITLGFKNLKKITSRFSRSFEINYLLKVDTYKSSDSRYQQLNIPSGDLSDADLHLNFNLHYLEVPLLIYWHPDAEYLDHNSEQAKFNFKIGGGISPAILLEGKLFYNEYESVRRNNSPVSDVNEKNRSSKIEDMNNFAFDLILDIHMGVKHGKSTLFTFVRYNHMLNSTFKDLDKKYSFSFVSFGGGYLF